MSDQLVAILGAGQLGRMLALAGYPLGLRCRLLDPTAGSPAGLVAEQLVGEYSNTDMLAQLTAGAACLTYEFENVPVATAQALAAQLPVYPPPLALETSQDRLSEKRFFQSLGAHTPLFAPVDSREELSTALEQIGTPAVLKTRRMGYDGKGQFVIQTVDDADRAWATLGGQALILEGFVEFRRELSILAVRRPSGETAFYPLVENYHREGILRRSVAPAHVSPALQAEAEQIAAAALDTLGYVGVLAIELFECHTPTEHGNLLVNEMAPRVHNSGHWTIEGAETSQFENHLRAVLDMPLGSTAARGASIMLNLIGTLPDQDAMLALPGAHLHLYNKTPRPGRKLGHLTICAPDQDLLAARLARAEALIGGA